MTDTPYSYRAEITRVIDGDTVVAMIDLGFDTHTIQTLRLASINAPEVRTKDLEEKKRGKAAKIFLEQLIKLADWKLTVMTIKDEQGKYGRYLAYLYDDVEGRPSLNAQMVEKGHAEFIED